MATTEDPSARSDESGRPGRAEARQGIEEADAARGVGEWKSDLYDAIPERDGELFSTISGLENEPLYTPDNVDVDYDRDLG
jgi:hypothetical protein